MFEPLLLPVLQPACPIHMEALIFVNASAPPATPLQLAHGCQSQKAVKLPVGRHTRPVEDQAITRRFMLACHCALRSLQMVCRWSAPCSMIFFLPPLSPACHHECSMLTVEAFEGVRETYFVFQTCSISVGCMLAQHPATDRNVWTNSNLDAAPQHPIIGSVSSSLRST